MQWIKTLIQRLIAGYRYCISPLLGHHCRFEPSCSAYATQALEEFGVIVGLWYTLKRVLKCAPWHAGGYDPVPCHLRKED
jgi:hypothetical protein